MGLKCEPKVTEEADLTLEHGVSLKKLHWFHKTSSILALISLLFPASKHKHPNKRGGMEEHDISGKTERNKKK